MSAYRAPCAPCRGTGTRKTFVGSRKCAVCDGRGYVEPENVVSGPFVGTVATSPDNVLRAAIGEMKSVIVIGHTKSGHEYFAASDPDGPEALWLLRRAESALLAFDEQEE